MRIPSRPVSGELSPSIAPLVGLVLLLALFVPLSSQPVQQRGQLPLPTRDPDFDPIVIEVLSGAGELQWRVNGTPMQSRDELRHRLTPVTRIKRDAPIILYADENVSPSEANQLLNLLRDIGFERVHLGKSGK